MATPSPPYSLYETSLHFADVSAYAPEHGRRGLVKDTYVFRDRFGTPSLAAMVFTDRIQVHNRALPHAVPYKGQANRDTTWFFQRLVQDIVPTSHLASLGVHVLVAHHCRPLPIEFIVRRYLTGRLWRYYQEGQRDFAGVRLPEKMTHLQALPELIITPALKTAEYDFHVSPADLIRAGYLTRSQWGQLETWVRDLFHFGEEYARGCDLVLLDTMFEFGLNGANQLLLIDELFTGDTSRYMRVDELEDASTTRLADGVFLGKETLRRYVVNTRGKKHLGDPIKNAETWSEILKIVSDKYLRLHEQLRVHPPVCRNVNVYTLLAETEAEIAAYAREYQR